MSNRGASKQAWKSYAFEFLSIFIAVIAGFALTNWGENKRDENIESKILQEIHNGLQKDIEDIELNKIGHNVGMASVDFWRRAVNNEPVGNDSIVRHYFNLTRDFISIQNSSGYQSLKSKGLELVKNDSLRFAIISLYEYDFDILRKFEESYSEMQFHASYFDAINDIIAQKLLFDAESKVIGLKQPMNLPEADKNKLRSILWKIKSNRNFVLSSYADVEKKVAAVQAMIKSEIAR